MDRNAVYEWCPFKKRSSSPTHEKMQGGGGHAQLKESGHGRSQALAPGSCTSSLQNCEKINFCCVSHPVCGICVYHLTQQFLLQVQAFRETLPSVQAEKHSVLCSADSHSKKLRCNLNIHHECNE